MAFCYFYSISVISWFESQKFTKKPAYLSKLDIWNLILWWEFECVWQKKCLQKSEMLHGAHTEMLHSAHTDGKMN